MHAGAPQQTRSRDVALYNVDMNLNISCGNQLHHQYLLHRQILAPSETFKIKFYAV